MSQWSEQSREAFEPMAYRKGRLGTMGPDAARRCFAAFPERLFRRDQPVPTVGPNAEEQRRELIQAQHALHEMSNALAQVNHAKNEDRLSLDSEARDELSRKVMAGEHSAQHDFAELQRMMAASEHDNFAHLQHEATVEIERRNEAFRSELNFMIEKLRHEEHQREDKWASGQRAVTDEAKTGVMRLQQLAGNARLSFGASLAVVTEELRQARADAVSSAEDVRSLRGNIARYKSAYSSVSETLVAERAAKVMPPAHSAEMASMAFDNEALRHEIEALRRDMEVKGRAEIEGLRHELSSLKADNEQLIHNLSTTISELDRVRRSRSRSEENRPPQSNRRRAVERSLLLLPMLHGTRAVGKPLRRQRRSMVRSKPSGAMKLAWCRSPRYPKFLSSEHGSGLYEMKRRAHQGNPMKAFVGYSRQRRRHTRSCSAAARFQRWTPNLRLP